MDQPSFAASDGSDHFIVLSQIIGEFHRTVRPC